MTSHLYAQLIRRNEELGHLYDQTYIMTSHDCAQLIRRNEELALLYEKIRINESTLDKGAQQYGLRNREVRT